MAALLNDLAALTHDDDTVRMHNSRNAMSDHERRPAFGDDLSADWISCSVCESKFAVASSRISTFGWNTIMRAKEINCLSPAESPLPLSEMRVS